VRATDEAGQPLVVHVAVRTDGRGAGSISTEKVDMYGSISTEKVDMCGTAPAPAPAAAAGGGGVGAGRGATYMSSADEINACDVEEEWNANVHPATAAIASAANRKSGDAAAAAIAKPARPRMTKKAAAAAAAVAAAAAGGAYDAFSDGISSVPDDNSQGAWVSNQPPVRTTVKSRGAGTSSSSSSNNLKNSRPDGNAQNTLPLAKRARHTVTHARGGGGGGAGSRYIDSDTDEDPMMDVEDAFTAAAPGKAPGQKPLPSSSSAAGGGAGAGVDVVGRARSMEHEHYSQEQHRLSKKKQDLLREWVNEWLLKWCDRHQVKNTNYWLDANAVGQISYRCPVTKAELITNAEHSNKPILPVARFENQHFGEELLATIWAFLDLHDLLYYFPSAEEPSIAEDWLWRNPLYIQPAPVAAAAIPAAMPLCTPSRGTTGAGAGAGTGAGGGLAALPLAPDSPPASQMSPVIALSNRPAASRPRYDT